MHGIGKKRAPMLGKETNFPEYASRDVKAKYDMA